MKKNWVAYNKTAQHIAYLGTGTNIGDRLQNLRQVNQEIERQVGKIISQSQVYTTEAWGIKDQGQFFNQVLKVHTPFTADELLKKVLDIELQMGRRRVQKWGPRLIDIDILYYDDLVISEDHLKVPHPFIVERNFVLVPLTEIAPDFIHPLLKKSNKELMESSSDGLKCIPLEG